MAEIDDLLDAKAAEGANAPHDVDALLDARIRGAAPASTPTAAQPAEEPSWWKQAASETGRQLGLTGRSVAQGVASLPMACIHRGKT